MRVFLGATLVILLAACGSQPQAECDPASTEASAPLRCDTAVKAALDTLPDDHAAIIRIQVLYGSARPFDCGGRPLRPDEQRVCAYVVFTFEDETREYVALAKLNDHLTARSPAPY